MPTTEQQANLLAAYVAHLKHRQPPVTMHEAVAVAFSHGWMPRVPAAVLDEIELREATSVADFAQRLSEGRAQL